MPRQLQIEGWNLALIEDDQVFQALYRQTLQRDNPRHQVTLFSEGQSAIHAIEQGKTYDCILLDLNLPDMSGRAVQQHIQQINSSIPIVYITGHHDKNTALDALSDGAEDYIFKDEFSPAVLIRSILYAIERKRARMENSKLQSDLENERTLNAIHKEFVCMVSHEFRTPLAIISTSMQLARQSVNSQDSAKTLSHLNKIQKSVHRLTALIDNALCFSRLEEGKEGFCPSIFDLRYLLEETVGYYRQIHPDQPFILHRNALPDCFYGDAKLCEQILNNLLSNAVKYSRDRIEPIEVCGDTEHASICIRVRDQGRGIAEKDMSRLGERFFRGRNTVGTAGSGIGLYLTRSFVELHHGTLSFESTEGSGTTVTLTLPLQLSTHLKQSA